VGGSYGNGSEHSVSVKYWKVLELCSWWLLMKGRFAAFQGRIE
jgi:hypothetical protein